MTRRFTKYPSNYVKATTSVCADGGYDLKSMTDDQLQELLTNIIDEREGYAEDDMSERALWLDEMYGEVDAELGERRSIGASTRIQASSEDGMHTSGFSFDFIHDGNYSSEAIKNILWDIFEDANCEFLGIDFESVNYSNSPEYRDYKVSQAGVDFRWFSLDGYDEDEIISQVEDRMHEIGYEVIGNPEFYSLEG